MPKRINPELAKNIGSALDELIKETGVSKSEIAREAGVEPAQITRIIKGTRYPSLELLIDLAAIFHVPTDYLLGLEHGPSCPSIKKGVEKVDV